MKNIIVGIDFSECSHNAMKHALSLAQAVGGRLTLLYVLAPDAKIFDESDKKVGKSNLAEAVRVRLKKLVEECKLSYPDVEYKIRIATGRTFKEINAEAEEQGDAWVVVGTHGSSGFEEFFIGSSAFKVVSYSKCPVFTIREANDISHHLENILLLIDSNQETMQKVKIASQLAKVYHAKIQVLGLNSSGNADSRALVSAFVRRAVGYMQERGIEVTDDIIEISATEPETIFQYAKEHKINLIVCMKEIELYANEVFVLTSFNERVVNRSPIPVLTIPVDYSIYSNVTH